MWLLKYLLMLREDRYYIRVCRCFAQSFEDIRIPNATLTHARYCSLNKKAHVKATVMQKKTNSYRRKLHTKETSLKPPSIPPQNRSIFFPFLSSHFIRIHYLFFPFYAAGFCFCFGCAGGCRLPPAAGGGVGLLLLLDVLSRRCLVPAWGDNWLD